MGMPMPGQGQKNIPIGKLLLMNGLITVDQLEYALKIQKQKGKKLGDTLIELGYVQEQDLMRILSSRLKVEYVEISKLEPDSAATALLKRDYCELHNVLPIEVNDKGIVVATTDPMNFFLSDDIRVKSGKPVRFVLATQEDIESHIPEWYSGEEQNEASESVNQEFQEFNAEEMEQVDLGDQLKSEIDNAPIVKFVNNVIETAILF